MKTIILLNICLMFLLTDGCVKAQINFSDKKAEEMLNKFYTNYITTIVTEPISIEGEKKLDSLQREYCTDSFLIKIPEIAEQMDCDPFLKAQDSDMNILPNLSINKDTHRKNKFTVTYYYDLLVDINPVKMVKDTITIHLTVVKENGKYLIDSVW